MSKVVLVEAHKQGLIPTDEVIGVCMEEVSRLRNHDSLLHGANPRGTAIRARTLMVSKKEKHIGRVSTARTRGSHTIRTNYRACYLSGRVRGLTASAPQPVKAVMSHVSGMSVKASKVVFSSFSFTLAYDTANSYRLLSNFPLCNFFRNRTSHPTLSRHVPYTQ